MNATNQKHYNYVTRARSCRWLLKANPRVSHPCIRFVCYFSQIFHRRNHERNTRRISRCFLRTTSCLRKVYCIVPAIITTFNMCIFLKIHWHYYNKIRDQTSWHVSPLNEQYWRHPKRKRKKRRLIEIWRYGQRYKWLRTHWTHYRQLWIHSELV